MFNDPALLILAIAALGIFYVLVPVAADAYGRFRFRRQVECPETKEMTSIQLDAEHAACSAMFGRPRLRIADCRYWPGRYGCERKCLENVA